MKQLTFLECAKRKLDETYLVIYAIKNEINFQKADYIEKTNIYSLIGIDLKGHRQFLNVDLQIKKYSFYRIKKASQ